MAKRKTASRKKKNNSFTIFLIVVIVLALISFAISYFVMQTDDEIVKSETNVEETKTVAEKVVKNKTKSVNDKFVLDGTWASYNDGAMLTINGPRFTIELPSVESTLLASGRIVVKGNTVTFIYTNEGNDCGVKPGVYSFKLENDEVTFKNQDDTCTSRESLIVAAWFKV